LHAPSLSSTLASDIAAAYVASAYTQAKFLIFMYAIYPALALLLLMTMGHRRFTSMILVVWALSGMGFGIFLASEDLGHILETSFNGAFSAMNFPGQKQHIADDTVWGLMLAQAVILMAAGCFAAVPRRPVRRVAWILYGLLIPLSLLLPIVEAALGAWVGLPRYGSWTWPDIALIGVGFGLCGLAFLTVSHWLCPNKPPVEPTADVEMELAI
jgi:hypothetical protein